MHGVYTNGKRAKLLTMTIKCTPASSDPWAKHCSCMIYFLQHQATANQMTMRIWICYRIEFIHDLYTENFSEVNAIDADWLPRLCHLKKIMHLVLVYNGTVPLDQRKFRPKTDSHTDSVDTRVNTRALSVPLAIIRIYYTGLIDMLAECFRSLLQSQSQNCRAQAESRV